MLNLPANLFQFYEFNEYIRPKANKCVGKEKPSIIRLKGLTRIKLYI